MIQISNKQKEFLTSKFSRINLLEGSVRSGKTWISLVAWALFVASMPKNVEFLMVGKTITTLKRNCLVLLQDLEPTFTYNTGAKQAYLYGRTIWLEGANDERSENKIRGMTLAGVYMDELTLIPEGFYYMALSRLSIHGAKLFATTNPDAPTNYVYTDIICNDEIARKITKFHITDNPFLDPEYVESLKHEYTGVFYERYFLGNWVKAEGLVYPMFDNVMPTQNRTYSEFCVSMDYGTLNPTAMLLWGHCSADDVWYVIDEFYHSGRDTNYQKTDEEYYEDLCALCGDRAINRIYIDPSAASFITLVRRRGRFHVNKANNDVMEGIQHTASCLADKRILVNDCCKNTIKEFGLYSWDEDKTVDTVIKENDHAMDAVRYFVQTKRIWREHKDGGYISTMGW